MEHILDFLHTLIFELENETHQFQILAVQPETILLRAIMRFHRRHMYLLRIFPVLKSSPTQICLQALPGSIYHCEIIVYCTPAEFKSAVLKLSISVSI